MGLSDQQAADFLAAFRERSIEDQQASLIWQELSLFPQWWGDAPRTTVRPPRTATEAPPDPRLPAHERAAVFKTQGVGVTDDGKGKTPVAGSMTSGQVRPEQNPWAGYKAPSPEGSCSYAVKTDVPPPWPGNWRRTSEGWFREA